MPFARYVARTGITRLKRYSIDKVFRESRLCGLHPRELFACSFDVVTQNAQSLVADAEVIQIVGEIITDFPVLGCRSYHIRINHAALLKAILLHCGVPESLHKEVYFILGDNKVSFLTILLLFMLLNIADVICKRVFSAKV